MGLSIWHRGQRWTYIGALLSASCPNFSHSGRNAMNQFPQEIGTKIQSMPSQSTEKYPLSPVSCFPAIRCHFISEPYRRTLAALSGQHLFSLSCISFARHKRRIPSARYIRHTRRDVRASCNLRIPFCTLSSSSSQHPRPHRHPHSAVQAAIHMSIGVSAVAN